MEGKYIIENSKSSRASCKRCKNPIAKDTLRIGIKTMFNEHESFQWNHAQCFKLPKNTEVDEFLGDLRGFQELDSTQQVSVHEMISSNVGAKRTQASTDSSSKEKSPKVKHSSPTKKSTSTSSSSTIDLTNDDNENEDEVYLLYKKMNLDELKDHLRWNNQLLKGTKPELIKKCVDGHKVITFLQLIM